MLKKIVKSLKKERVAVRHVAEEISDQWGPVGPKPSRIGRLGAPRLIPRYHVSPTSTEMADPGAPECERGARCCTQIADAIENYVLETKK